MSHKPGNKPFKNQDRVIEEFPIVGKISNIIKKAKRKKKKKK